MTTTTPENTESPLELESRYDPHSHEERVYGAWMEAKAFAPPAEPTGEPFVIMIPPPNVTGVLHMGHALNGTLQDVILRFQRMRGRDALWVPGTDHAGIATQAVVEKKLFAEENKTREELGREAFLERIWAWKEQHGSLILQQFKALGCSCDWDRTAFTLDEGLSRAVRESFVRLWEKDLIYRGSRLVNWDCVLETAVSDDEVEQVPQKGKLWQLRYPIKGAETETLTVATTRPETMLGDTGIAVHPDDERYAGLVGKTCIVPFVEREIPIFADESVDSSFGTGAVKVTPGHDPADYERGARHGLPIINIFNPDGTLSEEGGPFAGLPREEARKRIVAEMEERGLLGEVVDHQFNLPISDRSKSPIEPLISEQWFVKMEPLAQPAIGAVKSGALKIRPERWTKVYLDWLENVQDWCISRQLWWGHRIPVWYDEDGVPVASRDDLEIGSPHPETGKPIVRQDPDVLDTWASSWLWPFATLGWPERTPDLERFYPTHFLSTARDIIYLWVARMVMAGYELLDHLPEDQRCPFETCYIHATILDAKGKRMSKSAGNGIDPLDMVKAYGADAVRYSLVLLTREGQDVKLSEDRFEMGRRFTNKVWNAARFAFGHLDGERAAPGTRLEDRWILSRLRSATLEVTRALEEYRFNDAATEMYRFVWNDFCDWYLELAKHRLGGEDALSAAEARGTLVKVLGDTLRLLHPFTPFQTEVLWKALSERVGALETAENRTGMLITAAWPEALDADGDPAAEKDFGLIQDVVGAVRSIRALTMLGDKKPLAAIALAPDADRRAVLEASGEMIRGLAFLETLRIEETAARPPASAVSVAGGIEIFIPLGNDVDLGQLVETLGRRVEKIERGIAGNEKKLANAGFIERADPSVVQAERDRLVEAKQERDLLRRNLDGL